jgi:hypothetical protein
VGKISGVSVLTDHRILIQRVVCKSAKMTVVLGTSEPCAMLKDTRLLQEKKETKFQVVETVYF